LCGLWLVSCTPKIPDEVEIVILSTTDLHGTFDFFPQFSVLVEETKAKHKNVIVVDAGDRFTGNPFNDYWEEKQFPIIDLMNNIGYDVMVIGNHEFDHGVELLNNRIEETNSAVILANMEIKGSGLQNIKPYHIIKKDGINIAFLGLTQVNERTQKPSVLAKQVVDLKFYDPVKIAMKYRYLRKKSHVFVALTHMGVDDDAILADSLPELDLIIGGHSHSTLLEPVFQNGVMITQSERYARKIGKTTILLKKGVVSEITNELINLQTWNGSTDPAVEEKIQVYKKNPFFTESFATMKYGIPNIEQLGYMMTDAALQLPGVDFSTLNFSGIRMDSLPAGDLTYGDIFRLSPFNNRIFVFPITSAEFRAFLEVRNCRMLPAGFEFTSYKTPEGVDRIDKIMLPNGQALDENKHYNLAIDSYLFSMYLMEYADRATDLGLFVVDVIVDYMRNNPNMDYRNRPPRVQNN
jgi:2',3'-cyclic-nucleotide 2'-phosphodiesterase (5'-nucleotidase family)